MLTLSEENDILLSVDLFHEEYLDFNVVEYTVKTFPERFTPLKGIEEIDCGKLPYTDSPDLVESICLDSQGKVDSACFGKNKEITLDVKS